MKGIFSEKIKLLSLLLIFCLAFTFFGCSARADIELPLSDFEAEIRFGQGQELFVATIFVSEQIEGNREGVLCFSSPECMSGLSVKFDESRAELSLGGTPLGNAPTAYIHIISALSPVGAFEYLERSEGRICYSNDRNLWYFDKASRLPCLIESKEGLKIEILKFEGRLK